MLAQTGTRMVGDRLQHAYGSVVLMRCSGPVATAGLVLMLTAANVWTAMAGLGLMGSGLALTNPIVFGAVGTGGKTVSRRLTAEQAKQYRQWIANRRTLDEITAVIDEVSHQAAELLARAQAPTNGK
jgi:cytochrome c biogenesis protein CcdA